MCVSAEALSSTEFEIDKKLQPQFEKLGIDLIARSEVEKCSVRWIRI